jgi:hypothetical protein
MGCAHPDAPNDDPRGRALNQSFDVKLIVNRHDRFVARSNCESQTAF